MTGKYHSRYIKDWCVSERESLLKICHHFCKKKSTTKSRLIHSSTSFPQWLINWKQKVFYSARPSRSINQSIMMKLNLGCMVILLVLVVNNHHIASGLRPDAHCAAGCTTDSGGCTADSRAPGNEIVPSDQCGSLSDHFGVDGYDNYYGCRFPNGTCQCINLQSTNEIYVNGWCFKKWNKPPTQGLIFLQANHFPLFTVFNFSKLFDFKQTSPLTCLRHSHTHDLITTFKILCELGPISS